MIYLGIDYGDSRTGIAVSYDGKVALPLLTIDSSMGRKMTAIAVGKLIFEKKVDTVVIGYPKNMDGSSGSRVAVTEKFARALKTFLKDSQYDINIFFEDERLTTKAAERILRDTGSNKQKDRLGDQIAASIILESFLKKQEAEGNIDEQKEQ